MAGTGCLGVRGWAGLSLHPCGGEFNLGCYSIPPLRVLLGIYLISGSISVWGSSLSSLEIPGCCLFSSLTYVQFSVPLMS